MWEIVMDQVKKIAKRSPKKTSISFFKENLVLNLTLSWFEPGKLNSLRS